MKVVMYADNTIPLQVESLCHLLNEHCHTVSFYPGSERVRFETTEINCPASYDAFSTKLECEVSAFDLALVLTSVPYDSNWFFERDRNRVILSFSGWNYLTDLPIKNGIVYFVATILTDAIKLGEYHNEYTGCINDFWWDKTGVNSSIRAAFLCQNCKNMFEPRTETESNIREDIEILLDLVSSASRADEDVGAFIVPQVQQPEDDAIDIFLCHNSNEKSEVRELNEKLKEHGIRTWLDEDDLEPGADWQEEIQNVIPRVKSAAICVGASGIGPWQRMEYKGLISEFIARKCRIVPLRLNSAETVPELPLFLRNFTWLTLDPDDDRNLLRLVSALKKKGA